MSSENTSNNKNDHKSLPEFYDDLHVSYIQNLAAKLDSPSSYEGAVTEHLRMSGVYWSMTALSLLRPPDEVDDIMGFTKPKTEKGETRNAILDWIFKCYDETTGGFGGNIHHDGHLLYTLSALQLLALADALHDPRLQRPAVLSFISSLQQPDGSFAGDHWGEVDTRFSYCALSALSLLSALPPPEEPHAQTHTIRLRAAAEYVASCQNLDGGFGCVPGAESHAGQIFCCIGALSIAHSLDLIDDERLLCWWLAERQCDSGGLNGRPEKQADVCYSWWILSALSILGRVSWISSEKLGAFILKCQDDEDGGIADRPGDMADVFHTFFGIAGLSLIGYLHSPALVDDAAAAAADKIYRKIDPVYALPTDVVQNLGLRGQVMKPKKKYANADSHNSTIDDRLDMYDVYER